VSEADPRTAQLAENLAGVRERIARAARAAGRDPSTVALVAVTKFFPAADVLRLAALGITDVGENREQEAAAKAADVAGLADLAARTGVDGPAGDRPPRAATGAVAVDALRWHMIGQLQTNKARAVVRWASTVQSVDRPKLVTALSRAAADAGRELDCLVQVDLDPADVDPADQGRSQGRGGAAPAQVAALAGAVAEAAGLRLRGLMAVAPLGADPGPAMERLARLHGRLRADHPDASWLSAGMSGDLEAAVAVGATHVRIGSALLGPRPSPV